MDLSFSGAGFMGCYYFGVVNCFNKYIPRERIRRAAGASAGALSAAYYVLNLPIEPCLKTIMEMLEGIRSRPLGVFDRSHQIVDMLPAALDKMFPEDAHKIVSGRLFVGMTRLKDMKSIIVNEFESRQDLIDALNCSCFIPVWSGNHVSTYKGVKHIDGGFTNNLPVFDEHTIRICCFSGASDIAPNDGARMSFLEGSVLGMPLYFNRANLRRGRKALWPPSANFIIDILEQGYNDTKDFILSNDLIQCDTCFGATQPDQQPIYSKLTPTISPGASPALSRVSSYMDLGDLQRASSMFPQTKKKSSLAKQAKKKAPSKKDHRHYLSTSSLSNGELEEGAITTGPRQVSPSASKRSSFRSMLREKLHLVAGSTNGKGSSSSSPTQDDDDDDYDYDEIQDEINLRLQTSPRIVIESADCGADSGVDATDTEQRSSSKTIGQIMGSEKKVANGGQVLSKAADEQLQVRRKGSSCSSSSSDDAEQEMVPVKMSRYTQDRRQSQQLAPLVSPAERFIASRRNTQATIDASKLLMPAKFVSTADLLPSCPPSPNLNRHCNDCIRMRQEARKDGLDESVRAEAERYRRRKADEPTGGDQKPVDGKLRSKLKSPLRWFKSQLGSRTKYDFILDAGPDIPQVGGKPATTQAALETVAY